MNVKDWILELSHNRWGEDSLYQDYDYTDVFMCPVSELVVNEEVPFRNEKGPWNNYGWWNPTIRVGEVADDHVSLYIYYTESVNTTTKSRADVVFDKMAWSMKTVKKEKLDEEKVATTTTVTAFTGKVTTTTTKKDETTTTTTTTTEETTTTTP